MKNYLKMLQFLKGFEKLFALAVTIMFFGSFFEVFQIGLFVPLVDVIFNKKQITIPNEHLPQFVYNFVDYLNSLNPETTLLPFLIFVVCMILLKNFFVWAYSFVMSEISQRVMRDIRYKLYDKIQNFSLAYFSQKRTGELISRVTFDANQIENAVSYGLIDLIKQPFVILICTITVFAIDPKIALLLFSIMPFLGLALNGIGKKLKKYTTIPRKKWQISTHIC